LKYKDLFAQFPNLYRSEPSFSIGEGWFTPVKQLSLELETMILAISEIDRGEYRAAQVKDKFGELRFYMNKSTPEMLEAIRECEFICSHTCHLCGERADDREAGGGHSSPVCVVHFVHES